MKKWTFILVAMFAFNMVAWAGHDKPIKVSEMPKAAQLFIQTHFADQSIAIAKVESEFMDKNYDVIFTNGDKVEFDKKGKWTKVDCKHGQVPEAVIPEAIQKYVLQHYPGVKIVKIELADHKGYEVDLDNGIDIEFDKKMHVRDIDR